MAQYGYRAVMVDMIKDQTIAVLTTSTRSDEAWTGVLDWINQHRPEGSQQIMITATVEG